MLDIINLTKNYGEFTALSGVSFSVGESSICGLIGPNGAGKTTLLKACAGILKPDSGDVQINGEPVFDSASARKTLFYLPDEAYFPFGTTINGIARFYRGYFPRFNTVRFRRMLELFELNPKKLMYGLSKGMKRQALISLAVAATPEYLLMDESFDGIDPVRRSIVKDLLLEYMAESGGCILISSHNLSEVSAICDRVVMLSSKQVKIDCDLSDLGDHYLKIQAVFKNDIPEHILNNADVLNAHASERMLTGVLRGNTDMLTVMLQRAGAEDIKSGRLSLEEIFMLESKEENGGKYDVGKIFE